MEFTQGCDGTQSDKMQHTQHGEHGAIGWGTWSYGMGKWVGGMDGIQRDGMGRTE